MIDQVHTQNFQGSSSDRWDLGRTTLITGPNGAGKSTVSKALQLIVLGFVPGDEVHKTAGGQFESYCSAGAGSMTIEISVVDFGTVSKTWKKSRGKVSTKLKINGKDAPAATDIAQLLSIKVFDIIGFWRQTPSEQVSTLCTLAEIDPLKLAQIQEELDRVNSEKKTLDQKLGEAKDALKDHEAEMQEKKNDSVEEGFDPEAVESEIKELKEKIQRLDREAIEIELGEAKAKNGAERIAFLKNRLLENSEVLATTAAPSTAEDVSGLEAELIDINKACQEIEAVASAKRRIQHLQGVKEPAPPAYRHEDIEELKERIKSAEAGSGLSDKDKWIYEAMAGFFEALKGIKGEYENPADYKRTTGFIRSHFAELSARVKEAEGAMDIERVGAWKRELSQMLETREKYSQLKASWKLSQDEIQSLQKQLSDSTAPSYNKERHDFVLTSLARAKEETEGRELAMRRKAECNAQIEADHKELAKLESAMATAPKDGRTVEQVKDEKTEFEAQCLKLETQLASTYKWRTIKELADKKDSEIQDLSRKVKTAKAQESKVQREKAELLEQIQTKLADTADRMLTPERLTFQLPETMKNNDRIRFYLHKPDGSKTERGTLSGGERASFDLALGQALVGETGIVVQEAAEMDKERILATCDRLEQTHGTARPQLMLVGHSLGWLPDQTKAFDKTLNF